MRERLQHWFDVSMAEPRHRVSAVWFMGRGRPQEKHAPLQFVVLCAIPVFLLACWSVMSLPMLWKEWRLNRQLATTMALMDDSIESFIFAYENLPAEFTIRMVASEPAKVNQFKTDLAPMLFPFTRLFEPDANSAPHVAIKTEPIAQQVPEETTLAKAEAVAVEAAVVEETQPSEPKEIARIGQWQSKASDDGVEIVFNVGNRRGGKLSGYLWALATFETETGEQHIVPFPDSLTSNDDASPDDVKDGEHFATKRFRRTNWEISSPVAEPGRFTHIVVGVTDETGTEILRENHAL